MPPQTIALAFAASIYPPAVAAVIALGRGTQGRSRVVAFVTAAITVTYGTGVLILFVLKDVGATGLHYTPSAAVDLALGVLLLGLAVRLSHPRTAQAKPDGKPESESKPESEPKPESESKLKRRLQSRRLAFLLGLTLYALPSPIYVGAVKTIADAQLSTGGQLLTLAVTLTIMLWLIELPMLLLLIVPEHAAKALEQISAWFIQNGRRLAMLACVGASLYLITKGLVGLSK
jgi:hypothetical protein